MEDYEWDIINKSLAKMSINNEMCVCQWIQKEVQRIYLCNPNFIFNYLFIDLIYLKDSNDSYIILYLWNVSINKYIN